MVSVLAVMAGSCRDTIKIDTAKADELDFSPAQNPASVKAGFEGTAFPTDASSTFSVSAVALTGSTGTGQTLYFFNKAVGYDGAKWCFKADESGIVPRYYWPLAGGLNFYAFAPSSEDLTAHRIIVPETDPGTGQPETVPLLSGGGIVYKNYTIRHTLGETGGYATIEADAEKSDENLSNAHVDFMSATQLYDDVTTRTSSSVPLLFSHNLSQVRFQAVAARDLSVKGQVSSADGTKTFDVVNHVDITVDKIEIMNLYSKGSYYNIAPHWRDIKEKYNYFPVTTSDVNHLVYEEGTIGSRTPVLVDIKNSLGEIASMLVIPQSLTDARMKVWFTVRQTTVRNEGETDEFLVNDYADTYVKTIDIVSAVSEFNINTCVTFRFNIDLDEITLIVTYGDWKSDGELTPVI